MPTDLNPADHATRSVPASQLKHTSWLNGPKFLSKPEPSNSETTYDLVDPSIRAVHIEVIESLDTSSFINALQRFLSVRGPVKHIRSDRGTNFIGTCKELKAASNINSTALKTYLSDKGFTWSINPPHASHCGGSWERMIGLARRILDAMFLQLKDKLTHEVLVTFMAEVAAIINARPLVTVTMDPDD